VSFEEGKTKVLQNLIENPNFGNAAKKTIVVQLKHIASDTYRKQLLDAINQRGALNQP
jgi:hypothetical protein